MEKNKTVKSNYLKSNTTGNMKRILLSAASLLLTASAILAQEGMWLLHTLKKVNEADMKNMGLNLTADDIYNVNQSSHSDLMP
jgi:hypothetical protein